MASDEKPPIAATHGANALLAAPPRVINIGLEGFASELSAQGATVVHVSWTPPARGNAKLAALLARLGT